MRFFKSVFAVIGASLLFIFLIIPHLLTLLILKIRFIQTTPRFRLGDVVVDSCDTYYRIIKVIPRCSHFDDPFEFYGRYDYVAFQIKGDMSLTTITQDYGLKLVKFEEN